MGNTSADIMAAAHDHGLRFVRDLKRNERHRVFIADSGRELVVVRATGDAAEMKNLRTEANAHQMLRALTPRRASFAFPETRVLEDGEIFVSVSPFVAGGWYAHDEPFKLLHKITDRDLEDVFQVMAFLHRIRENQLTPFFRKAGKEFTLEERLQFQRTRYLKRVVGTPLCSAKEEERLILMMVQVGYQRRFVHHDIGPTNMARLADGRLLVTDAEFARLEMKWYDVAYSFLQLSVLHGEERLAKKWLRYLVRRFKEEMPDEDIETEIFFPLGYWIAANLFLSVTHPGQQPRARKMFEKILKRDLALLLD